MADRHDVVCNFIDNEKHNQKNPVSVPVLRLDQFFPKWSSRLIFTGEHHSKNVLRRIIVWILINYSTILL